MNLKKIKDDAKSEQRLEDLLSKGLDWRHYKNQLDKASESKRRERVQTWYPILLEKKPEYAEKLANEYREFLQESIKQELDKRDEDKRKQEKEAREKEEAAREAKRPVNVLLANMEKTGKKSATYGLSESEIDDLQERMFEELCPRSGSAKTVAGEVLRAWNYLLYRYYNDGDWFSRDLDTVYNPHSQSSWTYLCRYVPQLSYIYSTVDGRSAYEMVKNFEKKGNAAILNKIMTEKYYDHPNSDDSREDFIRRGRRY